MEEKTVRLQKMAARVILDWDFYTPSSTMFSDLKWMSFPERVIYMKDIEMFKQSGEMPLNTLGRHLLWRLIYMQACYLTIDFLWIHVVSDFKLIPCVYNIVTIL